MFTIRQILILGFVTMKALHILLPTTHDGPIALGIMKEWCYKLTDNNYIILSIIY